MRIFPAPDNCQAIKMPAASPEAGFIPVKIHDVLAAKKGIKWLKGA
jgi:hypothetical protein